MCDGTLPHVSSARKRNECETSVEHGLPLWAEPAVGYCSRRPRPLPMWGSRFVRARAVDPWVGEQKPLGKTPLRGNPSPESTYLPSLSLAWVILDWLYFNNKTFPSSKTSSRNPTPAASSRRGTAKIQC